MRAVERLFGRAKLPVEFSHGFNPRPQISLTVPRPVGIATRDDRIVVKLLGDLDAADVLDRLNQCAPPGMSFTAAAPLPPGQSPAPQRVAYTAALPADRARAIQQTIDNLQCQNTWPVERLVKPKRRRGRRTNDSPRTKTIDLKPRIAELSVDGETLHIETICSNAAEARPVDVLGLVGLDARDDLARLVRTRITDNTLPTAN
jgi:radical SAM-linked protein